MTPEVNLEVAMNIANKMVKPWQYTTAILCCIITGLLYFIITCETTLDTDAQANNLTASSLMTSTNINKR